MAPGLVQNGVAEFVAQEEMDRDTGYWWSPDDSHIAFTRIDDSPVQEVERFEINADGARMFRQRYPAAGTANTKVELKVIALRPRKVTDIDVWRSGDGYLARVKWFPDSKSLAIQRQTRDQKQLELLKVDAATGQSRVLLTETSPHWVELNDDFKFLDSRAGVHLVLPPQRLQTSVSVRPGRQAAAPADRRRMDGGGRRHRERPGWRR